MKNILTFALFVFFAVFEGMAAADEPNATEVDFYPSGAKFTFECKVSENGEFSLELPTTFSQVNEWRAVPGLRPGWIPPFLVELDAEIKGGRQKLSAFDAKISSLEQTLKLIREPQTKNDSLKDLLGYIREAQTMSEQTAVELAAVKTQRDELKTRVDLLGASFKSKMPPDASNSLKISGRGEKNSTVKVEAFSNLASWGPTYKMELDSKIGKVDAQLLVEMAQKTGINAKGLMRFHTNMPQRGDSLPELPPRIVDIRPPQPPASMQRMAAPSKMMMEAANDSAGFSMPSLAPEMTSGLAAVTVSGSGAVTGDGTTEEISLGKFSINSKISLVAVPEFGDSVYISAETEPLKQPLIAASGRLYVDGQAASSTYIRNYGEGERAKITFGTAPLVKVKRKDIVSKSDTSWWGSSGKLNDGYTVEITNGMSSAQTIVVKDRVPVSANSKITVTNVKLDPKPKEQDENNILTWEIQLKPGETSKISVGYTLEFPAADSLMFR